MSNMLSTSFKISNIKIFLLLSFKLAFDMTSLDMYFDLNIIYLYILFFGNSKPQNQLRPYL